MITEDYVSFETAKLLKEKGFDDECQKYYYELLKEHPQTFSIYEEACEAAIKYCLENLI